jgi:hypothetical protein
MKQLGWAIAATSVWAFTTVAVLWATFWPPKPVHPHPVCLISHRAVILIPTVCGAHKVCARPIVAELCDSVEMPAK